MPHDVRNSAGITRHDGKAACGRLQYGAGHVVDIRSIQIHIRLVVKYPHAIWAHCPVECDVSKVKMVDFLL